MIIGVMQSNLWKGCWENVVVMNRWYFTLKAMQFHELKFILLKSPHKNMI